MSKGKAVARFRDYPSSNEAFTAERKPLLDRHRDGSGSEWSVSDVETYAGDYSGRSSPSLLKDEGPTTASVNEPWGPLIAIFAITAIQPLCFELIFPFINQMILENGIADDPEKVGFYTGFIESIFQVTGFFAIMPCSWISDRYGRKPVVIIGTIGMAISIALFGMSKSYGMMIAMRCIGGTMGGTITAIKVMTAELYTDKRKTARALSLWQVSYKAGQIVGQPLGGLLSHPARTMPFFDTPFWREYPFALPCFASAAFALVFTVVAIYTVPETLKKAPASSEVTKSMPDTPYWKSLSSNAFFALASLFFMAFASEIIFVTYPLFAFTPIRSGGLGLSEPQIGAHMGARCFVNIIILLAYTPFASEDRALMHYKFCMWFWPVAIACLPILNVFARTGSEDIGVGSLTFYAFLSFFFMVWSVGNCVWPSAQMVINKFSPTPDSLASINGIAQMIYSITWAIAPATCTSLFAYSIEHRVFGGNFAYAVMLVFAVLSSMIVLRLKEENKDAIEDTPGN